MIHSYYLPKPEVGSASADSVQQLAKAWLPAASLDYADRYRHPARRLSYFCSRLLIRYGLSTLTGHDPGDFIITRATQGGGLMASLPSAHLEPALAAIDFSISHGQSVVGMVMSNSPVLTIGIDMESRERAISSVGLARRYFSEAAATWVAAHPYPDDAFLQLWTQAEALVKAAKTGMGNNTQTMNFILEGEIAYLAQQQILRAGLTRHWQSFSGLVPSHRWSIVIGYPDPLDPPMIEPMLIRPTLVALQNLVN